MTESLGDGIGPTGWAAGLRQRISELPFKEIIDTTAKLAAPAAVVLGALLAQSFQSSLSVSQMLAAREQSDTNIRAEMFKAITEKLLGAKDPDPARKAVFTELLALNFHEHFELKPLMTEVDEALRTQLAAEKDKVQQTLINDRRLELQSVVRRVRARQTAMLIRPAYSPDGAWVPSFITEARAAEARFQNGEIKMLSVRFSGARWSEENPSPSACDVPPEEPGQSSCVDEPMFENAPDGRGAISISVKQPQVWERETFTLRIQPMAHQKPLSKEERESLKKLSTGAAPQCGIKTDNSQPGRVGTSAAGVVEFDVTRFDLPLTDNTPLSSGSRYAVYIDSICPDGGAAGEKVVKFALMWFPRDYFPPRERPTNYAELRRKLNVQLDR